MVTGPNGEILGQPMSHEEGILYVDIDLADCVEPKQVHDIIGYYNRFDVFKLTVNRSANRPISFAADVVEREGHARRTGEPSHRGAFSDSSALRFE